MNTFACIARCSRAETTDEVEGVISAVMKAHLIRAAYAAHLPLKGKALMQGF